MYRRSLLHLVSRKIVGGHKASAFLYDRRQLAGHWPMIEIVWIGGDALQCVRQLRLLEDVARLIEIAITLENASRLGELGEMLVMETLGIAVTERVAFS